MSPIWFMTAISAGAMVIALMLTRFLPDSLKTLGIRKVDDTKE